MNVRFVLVVLLILLSIIGCENSSKIENFEIENKWVLLYKKEGCLTGGQHWGPGTTEGSIFREKEWKSFFKISPKLTIPFLMDRIDSKNDTNVHVCPFHMATEGELAVYATEHILKKNWFNSDSSYKELTVWANKREKSSSPVTNLLLNDMNAKNELRIYFLSEISNKNF